ncbi:TonB-dependent receptor [Luteimonas sp. M1R5S18]|uniref:TonB-dependent receptor n=1 Tax=Luteimonas rhizosphaericola TaxID=3042024 RepID=A0ABT6JHP0_9GAMM|nr:TonB-dependent receptor [Luteimonas rhizosphaericola]MDH5829963.1 TonB-dependent receptor [Luteimonas rhizosphaericola]
MNRKIRSASRSLDRSVLSCALAGCMLLAAPAFAQSTAGAIRGQVMADSAPATDARVTATNLATGLTRSVQTTASGNYNLAGLPPGTYRIDVTANGQTSSQNVTLAVGQTATLNLGVGGVAETAPTGEATDLDAVVVTAQALVETKTSEIATYVSQRQIEALPQNSRNFLAFADTVPGMQFISSPNGSESQLRSGAQGSSNINVFIDGVGQKNYVTPGGITGQDDSRGNPFPQSAIGEYKVITSNYKAEYDQISSAAVTAVTRSGTNEFEGSFFWDRTSEDWRQPTVIEEKRGFKSEEVTEQYGATFGGPIIQDMLHFFMSYEAKDFVVPRNIMPPTVFDPSVLPPELSSIYGGDSVPFNQDLYFGKLSLTLGESHLVDLSIRYRDEDSISPGADISAPGFATNFVNDETRVDLRYQFSSMNWLNDAHLTFEEAAYNPSPVTAGPGFRYTIVDPNNPANLRLGVLNVGGGPTFQDKGQKGVALQNDLTFFGWEGHTLKMGFKYKQVDLNAFQQNPPYPQYFFDVNESLDQPYRIEFTAPSADRAPFVESKNKQFGIYIQDDWEVNDKLTLNLGLRWDYEESPSFEDYAVDPGVVAALRGWDNIRNTDYDVEDYISNGSNRDSFKDAWQPRVGFSYDLFADQRHVIFGGAGRAYDRNLFDLIAREYYAGSFASYAIDFDTELHPCDPAENSNCIPFDPALLTPEGIAEYVDANPRLGGEVTLLRNDLKTPYSDQFSIGMRNVVPMLGHDWNTSVAISHIRSRDGIYFRLGNRWDDGRYYEIPGATWGGQPWGQAIPGYGSLILGDNGIKYNLNSLLISADKPFTEESRWGVNLAYTYSDAEENRSNAAETGENFVGDYPVIPDQMLLSTGVPKHRLVLSGIFDLGWDVTFSSKLVLATHRPRDATNCNDAPDSNQCFFDPYVPEGTVGFKQFDAALEKRWNTGTDLALKVRADVLNVFNWRNWNQFEGWRGGAGEPRNPAFRSRNGDEILLPTRTFKLSFGLDW